MQTYRKAYVEITNCCNLSCSFCPGTRRPMRTMSLPEFRHIAAKIRPATRYLYLHLMGEPLLHPQLEGILQIASEMDFLVTIVTNGTLLSEKGEVLLMSPAVRKISVSLHSFEANDNVGFEEYLASCAEFAGRAAAGGKLAALRLWNLDGALSGKNERNPEILEALHRRFPGEWREARGGLCMGENLWLEFGERFEWPDSSGEEQSGDRFCYALRDQVGVLCDGTVVPCCMDHEGELALGNLFECELEEIVTSGAACAIYDGFSRRTAAAPLCRRCGFSSRFTN